MTIGGVEPKWIIRMSVFPPFFVFECEMKLETPNKLNCILAMVDWRTNIFAGMGAKDIFKLVWQVTRLGNLASLSRCLLPGSFEMTQTSVF